MGLGVPLTPLRSTWWMAGCLAFDARDWFPRSLFTIRKRRSVIKALRLQAIADKRWWATLKSLNTFTTECPRKTAGEAGDWGRKLNWMRLNDEMTRRWSINKSNYRLWRRLPDLEKEEGERRSRESWRWEIKKGASVMSGLAAWGCLKEI